MNSAAFLREQWTGIILGMMRPLDRCRQITRDRSFVMTRVKRLRNGTRSALEIKEMRVPCSLAEIATTHGTHTSCQFTLGQGRVDFRTSQFFHAVSVAYGHLKALAGGQRRPSD